MKAGVFMVARCFWLYVSMTWLAAPFQATGWAAEESPPPKPARDLTQLSLEELTEMEIPSVVGASKHVQKITEAPSSVTIIPAEEIKKYGHRTLADVLQSVRGVHVTYNRNYSFLGMRGFNRPGDFNGRILVLVDGHRVNENIFDGGYIGTEFILDVDLIDRVEIIRGPGSVLYGNNAFFGVINVITRRGSGVQGTEASAEAASFDSYKGRFTYGSQFKNGLELLLSGSLYDSEGKERIYFKEFDAPQTNRGVAERVDDDQFQSFLGTLAYQDFTLQGAFVAREKGSAAAIFGSVFNDARNRTLDERSYVSLRYEHEFPAAVEVLGRLSYDNYYFAGDTLFDYAPPGGAPELVLNKNVIDGEWWGAELQARKQFLERLTLTLGAEYRDDFRKQSQTYDEHPFQVYAEHERPTSNQGVYLQAEWAVLTNLTLNLGGRYDHYGAFGDTANPRAALIFHPFPKSAVKLLYGTAFRTPNFYELVFWDSTQAKLEAETITTYEVAYEQSIGAHLRSTLAGYYNQIDDLIELQVSGFRNQAAAEAKGLELELEGQWAGGLRGRASYSRQETKDTRTGQILSNSPEHLARLNVTVPLLPEKLFAGAELQYTSRRLTTAGNEARGFWVANVTVFSQNLLKGLDLSAGVYNLFDTRYGDPGTAGVHLQDVIERDGRGFRMKLTYRF